MTHICNRQGTVQDYLESDANLSLLGADLADNSPEGDARIRTGGPNMTFADKNSR